MVGLATNVVIELLVDLVGDPHIIHRSQLFVCHGGGGDVIESKGGERIEHNGRFLGVGQYNDIIQFEFGLALDKM